MDIVTTWFLIAFVSVLGMGLGLLVLFTLLMIVLTLMGLINKKGAAVNGQEKK